MASFSDLTIFPGIPLAIFVIGCLIGSYVATVIAARLGGRDAPGPRSVCGTCGIRLGIPDLVPIVSYVALKGRCRNCSGHVPMWFPLVELAYGSISVWAAVVVPTYALLPTLVFGWLVLALALFDLRAFVLPDSMTATTALAGFVSVWWLTPETIAHHLWGGLAGFAIFFVVRFVYGALRKRKGLGMGDVKFFGALGLWVAWRGLPSVVVVAVLAGLVFVLVAAGRGARMSPGMRLPFGSFLAVGAWIVWLYGPIA